MSELCDAIVIGGGLAGAALGIELANAGRHVILFERESGTHDKVCGEFISLEGARYLERLGVSLEAMNACSIDSLRLTRHGLPVEAKLPFAGFSLSRRVLDEALLSLAAASGVDVRRGRRIKSLGAGPAGWRADGDDVGPVGAPDAFLATGKHDLRGWKRPKGTQSDLIGLKTYCTLRSAQAAALKRHVELILFPGGYAGLQPVEDNRANLCLLVRRQAFARSGNSAAAVLDAVAEASPHLRERLEGAGLALPKPLAIAAIPYGYVGRQTSGPWRLGDQAAVIPSFSGDGMSIALHSARLASAFYLAGRTAAEFQRQLYRDVAGQVWRATQVSRVLVNPLGQRAALGCSRAFPLIPPHVAQFTRIGTAALMRANAV